MERNTLLAIVLSALVLFSYQAIFVAPKQAELLKNTQTNAAQSVINENPPLSTLPAINSGVTTVAVNKTIDYESKTPNSNISYTNVGGSLHKIEFIGNKPFPITDVLSIGGMENAQYSGQMLNDGTVSLTYKDKSWQIVKTFKSIDKNLIKARMEIKNLSETSILNSLTFTAFEIDESTLDIAQNNRDMALFEYSVYENTRIFRKGNATKFSDKNYKNELGPVNWVGFRDHYHALIIKPDF